MSKNLSLLPISCIDLDFQVDQAIHRLAFKKRIFKQCSLIQTGKNFLKKQDKGLEITVKPYRYACLSPKMKALRVVENSLGARSLVQSSEKCQSPVAKPIVVNSVLKDTPLKMRIRPVSAFILQRDSNVDGLRIKKRLNKKKYCLKSQMASIENLFNKTANLPQKPQ